MTPAPGVVLADRYRVIEKLAEGGMGTVFHVAHIHTDEALAMKVIRRDLTPSPTLLERFRREARILAELEHPGVASFRDAGLFPDGSLFVVMELIGGGTLLDLFRSEAPLSVESFSPLVSGIAAALDAVHAEGIVHRDLKPGNVMLTTDRRVKLVDFGVARAFNLERVTITGHSVGTPRYMAPEQVRGDAALDARVDVYALGIIVWAGLAGRQPFSGSAAQVITEIMKGRLPPLTEIRPDLPSEIAHVVERATARDRADRFTSAGAFARAFESAASQANAIGAVAKTTGAHPLLPNEFSDAPPATRTAQTFVEGPARSDAEPFTGDGPVTTYSLAPDTLVERAPARAASRRVLRLMLVLTCVVVVVLGAAIAVAAFLRQGDGATAMEPGGLPGPMPDPPRVQRVQPEAPHEREASAPDVVQLASDPSGAEVLLDDVMIGNTPVDVSRPTEPSGVTYTLRLGERRINVLVLPESPPVLLATLPTPPTSPRPRPHPPSPRDRRSTPSAPTETPMDASDAPQVPSPSTMGSAMLDVTDPWGG